MTWIHYGTEVPISSPWPEEDWFTLGQISRWLAAENGGTDQLVARALLEDFKAGWFNGPYTTHWRLSEESEDFVLYPNLEKEIDLRWRVRWQDKIGRERWALVDSESAQALFADPSNIGGEYDPGGTFWLCKEAINRWCDRNVIERLHSWPVQDNRVDAWATHDEVLRALEKIGSERRLKIPDLNDAVSKLLGKRVSRRTLNSAKKIARSKGFISLYERGNPGKSY
jgi:hypothetical protein